eukprot:gene5271-2404_t
MPVPDQNFGDPTGSVNFYRRVCAAATEMSVYPRDPLPAAALPIVDVCFAAYPPPTEGWVLTYLQL